MPKTKKTARKKTPTTGNRLFGWIRRHKLDTAIIALLVVVSGAVGAVNMTGYPQRFEDEGTYVSQAWAIKERSTLAHYTYWYDHPPVGWMQMTGHMTLTGALERYGSAITAGREFMLILHLATIVLLFALARRLGIGSIAAGIGAFLYALSPLTVEFSRYVLLDNVAIPWTLAAFALALNPRKHLVAAIASAVCMAIAILSKETFAALLPVLLYALWTNSDKRNRRFTLTSFAVIFAAVGGLYILYAILKNELLPGEGHVSLLGTTLWQLSGREGSGSIFDANSGTRGLVTYWLNIDYWLIALGTIALPFSFIYKRLRVASFSLLIGLVLLLRTGYLPYPYIIALLPFAALVFAGVLHYVFIAPLQNRNAPFKGLPYRMALLTMLFGAVIFITPTWQKKLYAITSHDLDASSRQAVEWVDKNVSRKNRLVVESALWTDLEEKGFNSPDPVWLYKTETDPEVVGEIGGWKGIDYVVLNGPTLSGQNFDVTFPTVNEAIKKGDIVAQFGHDNQKILIYKIDHTR